MPSVAELAEQPDAFVPAEALLDQFAFLLAEGVARVTGGAAVDRAAGFPAIAMRIVISPSGEAQGAQMVQRGGDGKTPDTSRSCEGLESTPSLHYETEMPSGALQ